jgi:hypothetical protein
MQDMDGKYFKCHGCSDNNSCSLQVMGFIAMDECPCRDCIVKMICNTPCKDLHEHYKVSVGMVEQ